MSLAYHREWEIPVRIARIFNTYGPRMRRGDGRAVPTFIGQAIEGKPISVHGDGSQTRSLCFVDDLVEGFIRLLKAGPDGQPVNLGNPQEVTVLRLAEMIRAAAGSGSEIVFSERPVDDPEKRCPDIALARELLGWEPKVPLIEGLGRTVDWCRRQWPVVQPYLVAKPTSS